jgi:hypothetical protein
MRGRRPGRPAQWLWAGVHEPMQLGRTGITFEVWGKWRKKGKKLGTLTVSVGGLRWRPAKGKWTRRHGWREVAEWLRDRGLSAPKPRRRRARRRRS